MKKIKAAVAMSRTTSSTGDSFITLRVEDQDAQLEIVRVEIPLAEFARIVTGVYQSGLPAEISEDMTRFGKKCETKTVAVRCDRERPEVLRKSIKALEKDGWIVGVSEEELRGSYNHHRLGYDRVTGTVKTYAVNFARWVEA